MQTRSKRKIERERGKGRALAIVGALAAMVVGFGSGAWFMGTGVVSGQTMEDPAAQIAAQAKAMKRFERMDGTWRGDAWQVTPAGQRVTMTQTERVGPMLDGSIRVIEGRGYLAEGVVGFNAFAVISYDTGSGTYQMRSYAQGRRGDFTIEPTDDGFVWSIPAGPATIRYTAVIKGGTWKEIGERVDSAGKVYRFFEMTLERIGDTEWPAGGAVAPE